MPPMKIFTPGNNNGFIGKTIADALGFPGHVRQARVLVVAASKRAASDLLSATPGCQSVSLSDPEFRQAMGNDVDAIFGSGYLDGEPRVLVLSMLARVGSPVVEVDADGPRIIGRLDEAGHRRLLLVLGKD